MGLRLLCVTKPDASWPKPTLSNEVNFFCNISEKNENEMEEVNFLCNIIESEHEKSESKNGSLPSFCVTTPDASCWLEPTLWNQKNSGEKQK